MRPFQSLADHCLEAFWQVVVEYYPEAKHGDLSPSSDIGLQKSAEIAIAEWVRNNVVEELKTPALYAFLQVITHRCPDATWSNLSPERTEALRDAAAEAIEEWLKNEADRQDDTRG